LRIPIAADNAADDADLQKAIKKAPKLDDIVKNMLELAVRDAQDLVEEDLAQKEKYMSYMKTHDEQRKYKYILRNRMWDVPSVKPSQDGELMESLEVEEEAEIEDGDVEMADG
jgi:hypothetical protein